MPNVKPSRLRRGSSQIYRLDLAYLAGPNRSRAKSIDSTQRMNRIVRRDAVNEPNRLKRIVLAASRFDPRLDGDRFFSCILWQLWLVLSWNYGISAVTGILPSSNTACRIDAHILEPLSESQCVEKPTYFIPQRPTVVEISWVTVTYIGKIARGLLVVKVPLVPFENFQRLVT